LCRRDPIDREPLRAYLEALTPLCEASYRFAPTAFEAAIGPTTTLETYLAEISAARGFTRVLENRGHTFVRDQFRRYCQPVASLLQERGVGEGTRVVVRVGDGPPVTPVPAFAKVRATCGTSNAVLFPYNRKDRVSLKAAHADPIPFAAKDDRLIWRGATTGRFNEARFPYDSLSPRFHLARRAASWDPGLFDVGFSEIVQRAAHATSLDIGALARPALGVAEQLEAKYLLSLEGNDISTGLKWMLASRSLELMPKPRYCSWLLETRLEPWVHFVPVRRDLGDLEARLAWCRSHPVEAEKIADAGRAYMEAFSDEAREARLRDALLDCYLRRVRVTFCREDQTSDPPVGGAARHVCTGVRALHGGASSRPLRERRGGRASVRWAEATRKRCRPSATAAAVVPMDDARWPDHVGM
jgi:hypothetical protein